LRIGAHDTDTLVEKAVASIGIIWTKSRNVQSPLAGRLTSSTSLSDGDAPPADRSRAGTAGPCWWRGPRSLTCERRRERNTEVHEQVQAQRVQLVELVRTCVQRSWRRPDRTQGPPAGPNSRKKAGATSPESRHVGTTPPRDFGI